MSRDVRNLAGSNGCNRLLKHVRRVVLVSSPRHQETQTRSAEQAPRALYSCAKLCLPPFRKTKKKTNLNSGGAEHVRRLLRKQGAREPTCFQPQLSSQSRLMPSRAHGKSPLSFMCFAEAPMMITRFPKACSTGPVAQHMGRRKHKKTEHPPNVIPQASLPLIFFFFFSLPVLDAHRQRGSCWSGPRAAPPGPCGGKHRDW